MSDINKIGRVVLFHRNRSGLSRNELAVLADVGKTVIYDIEKGKTTIKLNTLWKILEILNIHITYESPLMNEFEEIENEKS